MIERKPSAPFIVSVVGTDIRTPMTREEFKAFTKKSVNLHRAVRKRSVHFGKRLNAKAIGLIVRTLPRGSFSVSGGYVRLIDHRYKLSHPIGNLTFIPKGYAVLYFNFGGLGSYRRDQP